MKRLRKTLKIAIDTNSQKKDLKQNKMILKCVSDAIRIYEKDN